MPNSMRLNCCLMLVYKCLSLVPGIAGIIAQQPSSRTVGTPRAKQHQARLNQQARHTAHERQAVDSKGRNSQGAPAQAAGTLTPGTGALPLFRAEEVEWGWAPLTADAEVPAPSQRHSRWSCQVPHA